MISAVVALGLLSSTPVHADDALKVWDWFPDISTEPPYVTGRRRRSLLRGEDPNDYASLVATTKDSDGVTWPCVVNPFKGAMWRLEPTPGEEAQELEMPTCRQAYGSVFGNFTALRLDGPTVEQLLAFLPSEVPALESLLSSSGDSNAIATVKAASRLELRYSDDGGVTQMAVELATRSRGRFVAPVNVGVLFFLQIEAQASPAVASSQEGVVHRVGIALTRPGAFSVFAHTTMATPRAIALSRSITSSHEKLVRNQNGGKSDEEGACTNPSAAAAAIAAASLAAAASSSLENPSRTQAYQPLAGNVGGAKSADSSNSAIEGDVAIDPAKPLKVMTYNVWNLNPPPYVYKDAGARWDRYEQRIDQLVKVILDQAPDVVALQEVRHDDSFGPPAAAAQDRAAWESIPAGTSKGAAQVRHLASRLAAGGLNQYVYQPAMLYYQPPGGGTRAPYGGLREEEGHAIFSKLPLVDSSHLLLPRDGRDGEDGHQRAVLHAALHVPWWPLGQDLVDVYSTHWALSPSARVRSAAALDAFTRRGQGAMSVVMGDFNAEPHEDSLQALQRAGFQDAWLRAGHPEPVPGSSDSWAVAQAHTFPSCNAVKRIDFVLVRPNNQVDSSSTDINSSSSSSSSMRDNDISKSNKRSPHSGAGAQVIPPREVEVMACSVVGQEPAGESYIPRDGLGMLDDDSPVWGSDHRAVVAELRLK